MFKNQHGFRANHGCDTQLLNTVVDLIHSFDANIPSDLTVLDFSKAFDVVSHPKLLQKIISVGIHPSTTHWIASWLHDRRLAVTVNQSFSTPRCVTSGVPQGSVLGPLLFLIFINDMPLAAKTAKLKLFADDSLLYQTINTPADERLLQYDLDRLFEWASKSQMLFNVLKCEHMRISRMPSSDLPVYTMNDRPIASTSKVKYLGVYIDNKLSFDQHINHICGKATRTLHLLMRNLKKAKPKTRKIAYITICRPILEYASQSWSPHLQKHIRLIENINRKAFRWAYSIKKFDSISSLMADFNWPVLELRRISSDLNMYARIVSGKAAVDREKILPHQSIYSTRNPGSIDFINTDVKKYSYPSRILRLHR